MKAYKVRPYNSIWFGGLKHMTGGEEHYLKTEPLPNIMRIFPYVKDKAGKGACHGVFLYDETNERFLLPAPADIVGIRKKGGNWKVLNLRKINISACGKEIGLLPVVKGTLEPLETAGNYFITEKGFEIWRKLSTKGNCSKNLEKELIPYSEVFTTEIKVGLKTDKDKGTAEEGMLFFQERLRFKNDSVKLSFIGNGYADNDKHFIGGERNPADVSEIDRLPCFIDENIAIEKDKYYKFYLLTHAYSDLIIPSGNLVLKDIQTNKVCKFQILWVFSKGSEFISGYNKPALQMIKPGSVFVLKAVENATLSVMSQLAVGESSLSNIEAQGLKRFAESGWNTGILTQGGVNDE
ncbi:type III-B CRISPR module-associated Cmr3 family protein [Hydrogenivirga sp.]